MADPLRPLPPLATDLSEDEDVLQALLPGQVPSRFISRQLDNIVRRRLSREDELEERDPDVLSSGSREQRLFTACVTGDVELAAQALDEGADPNTDMQAVPETRRRGRLSSVSARPHARLRLPRRQQTLPSLLRPNILLHLVAELGDVGMLELLLRRGADPARQDAIGDTALHVVCRARHPIDLTIELVRLLHEWRAPLDAANTLGLTPLQQAAAAGNTAALLTLAELGAPCGGQDSRGNTLLHFAVNSGSPQTVSAALDRLPAEAVHQVNKAGRTPLQLAKNRETVRVLLAAGSRADEPTTLTLLDSVPSSIPDVLNHYMTTNDEPLDGSQLEVYLDYTPFWDDNRRQPAPETGVLRAIVDADQEELLKHPIVETFMHIKWLQIRHFFFVNFVFYIIFALLVTAYGLLRVVYPDAMSTDVLACLAAIFTVFCAFREVFQMAYSWRLYVKSVENWLELVTIALTSALLIGHSSSQTWVNHVVAWLMLSTWMEMTLMVGRIPSIGIYIYMFVRVAQQLIRFLLVYSPLLVAFALSFRVLFHQTAAFRTIPLALIKTFVMMMGEYDYDGMFTSNDTLSYPGTSHLLMILFIVSMSIITVNLLIGLTVNDLQGLFKTAGVQRLRMTVIQILYIESVVYSNMLHMLVRQRICKRMQERLALLPKLMMRQVDKHFSSLSKPADEKTPPSPSTPSTEAGFADLDCRVLRAAFRPNAKGRPRLYRPTPAGDLTPSKFTVHSWMLRNMLCLLRERTADKEREAREQLLQAEILAAVRAKTAVPDPFDEYPEAEPADSAPASGRATPAPADGDAAAAEAATGRRRRGRKRKKAVPGRDSMQELGQKLNTVLAAVSEVSLKMGILERRLNLLDPPKLDTFYSV